MLAVVAVSVSLSVAVSVSVSLSSRSFHKGSRERAGFDMGPHWFDVDSKPGPAFVT